MEEGRARGRLQTTMSGRAWGRHLGPPGHGQRRRVEEGARMRAPGHGRRWRVEGEARPWTTAAHGG
jgi:hypothetical protein